MSRPVGTPRDEPARQGGVRDHNLALVLRQVLDAPGPVSRADIAASTGLTRATVSSLVDALVEAGLVHEGAHLAKAGAGRPATGLTLAPDAAAGIGLEVNVDYLATCVVDLAGRVRHRRVVGRDQRGGSPGGALRRAGRLTLDALDAAATAGLTVAGVAVALPGLVQAPDGPLRLAPNLGWRDVDVVRLLAREPRLAALPVTVDNEADLAALAELYAGRSEGPGSFVHVSGEVGIGAGIVLDGRLYRGRHGWSGELGHVTVHPDGLACGCGSRGCLEQYAGQEAILRAAGVPVPVATSMGGAATVEQIAALGRSGHPTMLAALRAAGSALGVALAGAVNLLDVDAVVLGGIYGPLAEWVLPEVERELAARVLGAPWSGVEVRASRVGPDAAVRGAAGSVVRAVLDDPAGWVSRGAASARPASHRHEDDAAHGAGGDRRAGARGAGRLL